MNNLLNQLFNHQALSETDAHALLMKIITGEANDAQIVAAISAMMMRNVTAAELKGFRTGLLEQAIVPQLDASEAIDVCGTGGDAKNTFNISTLAAFVIAAAGYRVIKHGNYGVSSFCGSSTILEKMGYHFTTDSDALQEQLDQEGICFLHAPLFHPCLQRVRPIRKALGIRTFFNFLGPLVNPVQPAYQLTGVYNLNIARLYRQILSENRKGFCIVHGLDGYDEVSLTGAFKVITKQSEALVFPDEINQEAVMESDLFGGADLKASQTLFRDILSGLGTQIQQRVVMVNAAYGIRCFNPSRSFDDCLEEAKEALVSGKALMKFRRVLELSQQPLKTSLN